MLLKHLGHNSEDPEIQVEIDKIKDEIDAELNEKNAPANASRVLKPSISDGTASLQEVGDSLMNTNEY